MCFDFIKTFHLEIKFLNSLFTHKVIVQNVAEGDVLLIFFLLKYLILNMEQTSAIAY